MFNTKNVQISVSKIIALAGPKDEFLQIASNNKYGGVF